MRKAERNIEMIYRRALAALFDVQEMARKLDAAERGSRAKAMFAAVEMFKRREIDRHVSNGADHLALAGDH